MQQSVISAAESNRRVSAFGATAVAALLAVVLLRPLRPAHIVLIVVLAALYLQHVSALKEFQPDWTAEVTIAFPSNVEQNELKLSANRGSISGSGLRARIFTADFCQQGVISNTVSMTSASITGQGSICATGSVQISALSFGTTASLVVESRSSSAAVVLAEPYGGKYNVTSVTSSAFSGLSGCTASSDFFQVKAGSCGVGVASIAIIGRTGASLSQIGGAPAPGITYERWSNASTWGGSLPTEGADVTIATGKVIMLDVVTPSLGVLNIEGTLFADPAVDFAVTASAIRVAGALRVGAPGAPYTRNGRFTLTGAKGTYISRDPLRGFSNDGNSRSIRVMPGAAFELYGNPPVAYRTRLNAHAAGNATTLVVDSTEGWRVGDQIAISPTTLPTTSTTDLRTIVAVGSQSVTIDKGLSYARWGRLQYLTDNGVSLDQATFSAMRAHADIPNTLDERAVIIHLTRNIVIEGANDTHWQSGHGVHVMWMGVNTTVQLDGVEVRRAGQAGALGRYPLHAHMQSYNMPNGPDLPSDGVFLGNATKTWIRNCVVRQSVQRAYVLHGTCGARLHNNVAYDIKGHAFFLEDGSEIYNELISNTVLRVRLPAPANVLLSTDTEQYGGVGSSGFWISNPWNYIQHNIAGDIFAANYAGIGFWNAYAP